jgi:hypothetical protein
MVVALLTTAQQTAIDALVVARRVEQVPPDAKRAQAFVAASADRISQLALLSSSRVKYDLAYDAAHDIGEAFLAAHGYRTRNGAGQHEAVGRFLTAVLDSPPGVEAAGNYDRLRRTRNRSHYDARPIGEADVALSERTAVELLAAARSRGVDA